MNLGFLNNPIFKKGMKVTSITFSSIAAIVGVLSEQRKAEEFRKLQEDVAKLQKLNK